MGIDIPPPLAFSCSFQVMYHGNALVKDFQGIETTRESIEKVKMSKDIINRTGMPTTVYISDTEVRSLSLAVRSHFISTRLETYPALFTTPTTCVCLVTSPRT